MLQVNYHWPVKYERPEVNEKRAAQSRRAGSDSEGKGKKNQEEGKERLFWSLCSVVLGWLSGHFVSKKPSRSPILLETNCRPLFGDPLEASFGGS